MTVMPVEYSLYSVVDELADDCHIDGAVVRLMLQVDLLLMNSMEMSTSHLEAHEDLDVLVAEEEDMRWSTVMLSTPMMKLLVMMDRWSLLLPGDGDGPQAACALLPCENRWVVLSFQSQDGSDEVVCRPLLCHPGLHDDCQDLSLSLSLVDDYDGCSRCGQSSLLMMVLPFSSCCTLSHDGSSIMTMSKAHGGWMLSQISPLLLEPVRRMNAFRIPPKIKDHACNKSVSYGRCVNWRSLSSVTWEKPINKTHIS